jgi:metal-responsive CopG/Arc/MetJ family transcriptional regulator
MQKRKSERITVLIPKELSRTITKALASARKARENVSVSRSDLVREILTYYFESMSQPDELRSYEDLAKQSIELENGAIEATTQHSHGRARKMFLLAAAREIEALALLDRPNENNIKTTVIRAVMLLKDGSGYNHLPDYPSRRVIPSASVSS